MENGDKKPGVLLGCIYCVFSEGSETFTSEEANAHFYQLSSTEYYFSVQPGAEYDWLNIYRRMKY